MAFCNMLAAWTEDPAQIDRIFRNTGLMRDKWDSPRGDSTYGWNTIFKAIAGASQRREELRAKQMAQAADQAAGPAPAQAAAPVTPSVPLIAADSTADQLPAQNVPLVQGQVLTEKQILAKQKQQQALEFAAKYPTKTAEQLYDETLPPTVYLVKNIMAEGVNILVAASKFGKSFMALLFALCIASGKPFLGHETTQSGVLYMALEDSWTRLQGRMKIILQGQRPPKGFHLMIEAPGVEDGLFDFLDSQLAMHPEIKLIIIDTFQKVRGTFRSREGFYANDYRELGAFKWYAKVHKVSFLFLHHTNKREGDIDPYNRINGSVGVMGAADTIWVADKKRGEDTGTLIITGRDVTECELVIRFDKETLTWGLVGTKEQEQAKNNQQLYEDNPIVQVVKELIDESDDGKWDGIVSDIRDKMGPAGLEYSLQKITRTIDAFESYFQLYDNIKHYATQVNSNGAKRHHFYLAPDPQPSEPLDDSNGEDAADPSPQEDEP